MKNKGLLIFNIIFISIGIIALISSVYTSKPMNVNEIQYYGLSIDSNEFRLTIMGSNNSAYKLEKYEYSIVMARCSRPAAKRTTPPSCPRSRRR